MKFAHLADCHLGAWREPKLRDLCVQAFEDAIAAAVEREVDFILIAGDLFNTAIPGIEIIKTAVRLLKAVRNQDIPVYIIPGSHDFSPSGKTMIDVLEEAELVHNVMKGKINDKGELNLEYTTDKTGAKITGIVGKKGMLDRKFYETLKIKDEKGFRIFMFHTALEELKPKELEQMEAAPVSMLPKGFDYYAGGHVHIVRASDVKGYKNIVYPGPVFPANFAELEKLGRGGFYFYDNKPEFIPIELVRTFNIRISAQDKTPEEVMSEIESGFDKKIKDNIVLLRIEGKLKSGRTTDVNSRKILELGKHAFHILINKSNLSSQEFEEIKVDQNTAEDIEEEIISQNLGKMPVDFKEEEIAKQLIKALSLEKQEGEKVAEYQSKIKGMVREILRI